MSVVSWTTEDCESESLQKQDSQHTNSSMAFFNLSWSSFSRFRFNTLPSDVLLGFPLVREGIIGAVNAVGRHQCQAWKFAKKERCDLYHKEFQRRFEGNFFCGRHDKIPICWGPGSGLAAKASLAAFAWAGLPYRYHVQHT